MASNSTSLSRPDFLLSPHQQNLLFAALNSNHATTKDIAAPQSAKESSTIPPTDSPIQQTPGSGTLNGLDESPFIDYDYDFDPDGSFDYDINNISQDQMIGKLPGSSSDGDAESHDKRSHPDDDEDNDVDGGGKRREGDERGSRKPGRKPLTSEPTSKRKAQNRAAQRAFRERKERHLKDLETKVQDLEKASESANQENSILRAQLEKMAVELKEYKKRLSMTTTAGRSPSFSSGLPPYLSGKGLNNSAVSNPNDVNFQFEFPKFGRLPGPPPLSTSPFAVPKTSPPASLHRSSTAGSNDKPGSLNQTLPHQASIGSSNDSVSPDTAKGSNAHDGPTANDMSEFSGLFSPSLLETVNKDFSFDNFASLGSTGSTSSSNSANGHNSTGHNTSYNSPSDSSTSASHRGVSSSCGTSPEPTTNSPSACKPLDNNLSIIGEEHNSTGQVQGETSFCEKLSMACGNPNNPVPRTMSVHGMAQGDQQDPALDVNSIDWFAQQNGNQFDPQLFGDYREPQNNILAGNGLYDDSFFSEAFAMPDFNSPPTLDASPVLPKKDLVAEIDDRLNAEEEVVPGEAVGQMLTCNNMWEKLQQCPSVQSGEIDMDSLCSQLQQKAKCSGDGPVIDEKDFKSVIHAMFPGDKYVKF